MKTKYYLCVLLLAVSIPAWGFVRGDLNNDGVVDVSDVSIMIDMVLGKQTQDLTTADLSGDGNVDVSDVSSLIDIVLGKVPTFSDEPITFKVNGVSFMMIPVAEGTFTMGSPLEDWQSGKVPGNETPNHEVTLSSYYIGQTEVTQELWLAVMGNNPSRCNGVNYDNNGNDYDFGTNLQRPVDNVSWNDCQTFITKLNELTGKTFRLPTEAEWEFAARGGNKSQGYEYAGGGWIYDVAWFETNCRQGISEFGSHAVGTKQSNELGLYDMSGNVCEWCNDWYDGYSSVAQTNPTGPANPSPYFHGRVKRGGSWGSQESFCRVKSRQYEGPAAVVYANGLRLAM